MSQLDDDITVAEAVLQHFPKATEGDMALIRGLIPSYPVASLLEALQRHREALGANAWRPDVAKLKAMLQQGQVERQSDAARLTRAEIEARREVSRKVTAEVRRANDIIAKFGPEQLQAELDAMLAAFRTGKLTRDPLGKPDADVGEFRARGIEKRPSSEASRLALAAWLEGVAR